MIPSNQALADFCIQLHRQNSEQLGLLPADRMRAYVDAGQVFHAEEGGDVCGYLIAGLTPPWAKVWQACVEYSLRGLGHGAVMVAKLEAHAKRNGCTAISLRCRDGLDSNLFWQALGFSLVRQVPGGGRRGKPLNVWAMQIRDDLIGVAYMKQADDSGVKACPKGKGNAESYCSCSHGAGRVMSRTEAKRRFSLTDLIAQTEGVECRKDEAVIDEIPGAYKSIDQVMENQRDLVEVVHTLKQVVCIKG
jgi:GNAT superfamily N-acetyltransferase